MDQIIDGRGGRLDLLVRAGSDMPTIGLELTNDDDTAYDLTGCTVEATASTRADPPVALSIVVTVTDAPNGLVTVDMAEAEIGKMTAPGTVTSKPRTSGDWVLDVVSAGGRRTPEIFGELLVAARP